MNAADVTVRRLAHEDTLSMNMLHHEVYAFDYAERKEIRRVEEYLAMLDLRRSDVLALGAFDGDDLLGVVAAESESESAEQGAWVVQALAVDPAAQRQGLGDRLVTAIVAELRDRGATDITAEVTHANVPARYAFDRQGMTTRDIGPERVTLGVDLRSHGPA